MSKNNLLTINKILKTVILVVIVAIFLSPFYFILVNSFKTRADYYKDGLRLPQEFVLVNYREILLNANFLRWILNSGLLTLGSVVVSLGFGSLTSYAIAKIKFPGRIAFYNIILPLMIIPPIVMFIPLYILFSRLQLLNNLFTVSIIYTGIQLPFSIFLLVSFYKTIPDEIIAAATIDGCNHLDIVFRIIMPLSSAAWITLAVVNALYVWNELLLALIFLQKEQLKTLMVAMTVFQGRFGVNVPMVMAGSVIAAVPMVVLYFSGQKYFVRGLVAGSLKS